MHTSLFHACALLFELCEKDAVTVVGEAQTVEVPSDLSSLMLPETVPELLKLARAEMKENNIENALAVICSALDKDPKSGEAGRLRDEAERKYIAQTYQNGFSPRSIPRLLGRLESIETERLGPEEGFVLSRINGELDVASIILVCPFREAESLRMIKKLAESGIIGF